MKGNLESQVKISVIVQETYPEQLAQSDFIRQLFEIFILHQWEYQFIPVNSGSAGQETKYVRTLQQKSASTSLVERKEEEHLKMQAFLRGLREAKHDIVALIDADVAYPPHTISDMVRQLDKYDVVVAGLQEKGIMQKFFSRVSGTQPVFFSGLNVFRKNVFYDLLINPHAISFQEEFIYKAKKRGWRVGTIDAPLKSIPSRADVLHPALKALSFMMRAFALRTSFALKSVAAFFGDSHYTEVRFAGFQNTVDYLFRSDIHSIRKHIHLETVIGIAALASGGYVLVALSYAMFAVPPLITFSAILAFFYFSLMLFKLNVVSKAIVNPFTSFSDEDVARLADDDLPVFTVLIPLYKEAEVIGQIKEAMTAIEYPPDKLDIIITLEEYDRETIEAIERAQFPPHFRTLILPDVKPKTKPKALNVALLEAKGEFLVIYDAEIIPDPDQLKKAVLAFRARPDIDCFQTRLDHYNANDNLITKLFNAEFSFHYDLFLPGLQKSGYPIPLSGHSTHFRTEMIRKIGGWDPYNVAEDCDLGIRLQRMGGKIGLLDSMSMEEATNTWGAWLNQRTRWMKGFIQTSIVHLRQPFRFKKEIGGWKNFFAFLFVVPASVLLGITNVLYWVLLVSWFATQSPIIEYFFPPVILYVSITSFICGNLIFAYLNFLGSYQRKRYGIVRYSMLSPLYWLFLSIATFKAFIQLVTRPHHWDKTKHGTQLTTTKLPQ